LHRITDCYVLTGKLMIFAASITLFLPLINILQIYRLTVVCATVKIFLAREKLSGINENEIV
jgi:hypothetical protein